MKIYTTDNKKCYEVGERIVTGSTTDYRNVYLAMEVDAKRNKNTEVVLVIYDRNSTPDPDMFTNEVRSYENLIYSEQILEMVNYCPDALSYPGKSIDWIALERKSMRPLRAFVDYGEVSCSDAWNIFTDLIVGSREIYTATFSGVHTNLNPDTVQVYTDSEGEKHAIITGLNFVTNDFDDNAPVDSKSVCNFYRSPESYNGTFTKEALQYSLALLLAYMLQGIHPFYDEKNPPSDFRAVHKMRNNTPHLSGEKIPEKVRAIICKALSADPGDRYGSLDEFVDALVEEDLLDLPIGYQRYDGSSDEEPTSSPAANTDGKPDLNITVRKCKGVGFKGVAGMNQLKSELQRDFVDVYRNEEVARAYGLGAGSAIFFGPPGCGKTFIANRLAEEMGIDFLSVTPSDLGSTYIHGSQLLIRQMFDKAVEQAKTNGKGVLIFFDEMDALCPEREAEDTNRTGEVAEFLVQLSDLARKKVYVVGATNCLDKIDKAIIRKGRINKMVYVGLPDEAAREELFKLELKSRPHSLGIDYGRLAKLSKGFTSSDISFIVAESSRLAFSEWVKRKTNKSMVRISQSLVENVIANTVPSVNDSDLRRYEAQKAEFANGPKQQRARVGYQLS